MFNISWECLLNDTIKRLQHNSQPLRIAIIGIGNESHGDDAAGVMLVRGLQWLMPKNAGILVIDAGTSTRRIDNMVRDFDPDLVVLAETVRMGQEAGTLWLLPCQATGGFHSPVHGLPLQMSTMYLERRLGCEVMVLGIQPAATANGTLSMVVNDAVHEAARDLAEILLRSQPRTVCEVA